MVTIKQLQRDIAEEKRKIKKFHAKGAHEIKLSKLKTELFKLKHRRAIAAGGKGARLLRRAGKGIVKAGKKVAPVLVKQARLIREQQLRDDAIERKLAKVKKIKPKKKQKKRDVLDIDF